MRLCTTWKKCCKCSQACKPLTQVVVDLIGVNAKLQVSCVFHVITIKLYCVLQANVDRNADPAEWRLEALANKLVQYCVLLEGLTADDLANNSKVRSWFFPSTSRPRTCILQQNKVRW